MNARSSVCNHFQDALESMPVMYLKPNIYFNKCLCTISISKQSSYEDVALYSAVFWYSSLDIHLLSGFLYCIGGWDSAQNFLSTVERFDPKIETWSEVSPMNLPRLDAAVLDINGRICVMG